MSCWPVVDKASQLRLFCSGGDEELQLAAAVIFIEYGRRLDTDSSSERSGVCSKLWWHTTKTRQGGVTAITTALMEKATAVETGAERSSTETTR